MDLENARISLFNCARAINSMLSSLADIPWATTKEVAKRRIIGINKMKVDPILKLIKDKTLISLLKDCAKIVAAVDQKTGTPDAVRVFVMDKWSS